VAVGAPLEAVTSTHETEAQVEAAAEAADVADAAAEAEAETDASDADVSEEMVISAEGEGVWQDFQSDIKAKPTFNSAIWRAVQEDTMPPKPALVSAAFKSEKKAEAKKTAKKEAPKPKAKPTPAERKKWKFNKFAKQQANKKPADPKKF